MTDRVAGFVVTLEKNIREDDVESIKAAILQLRHVVGVTSVIANPGLTIAEERVRHDLTARLFAVLHPEIARSAGSD